MRLKYLFLTISIFITSHNIAESPSIDQDNFLKSKNLSKVFKKPKLQEALIVGLCCAVISSGAIVAGYLSNRMLYKNTFDDSRVNENEEQKKLRFSKINELNAFSLKVLGGGVLAATLAYCMKKGYISDISDLREIYYFIKDCRELKRKIIG